MGKLPNLVPISDLRQDAAKVLKQVRESREPLIITQRGRAAAVMLSVESFERSERDKEILRLLARGEREIASGKGFDLETVMAEAKDLAEPDRLLVKELKGRLQEVAGDRLQAVIAYGSRVWGHPTPESDLDVAAIIRDLTPEMEEALQEAAYQVMWDHDFYPLISLKVLDAKKFSFLQEQGFSFYCKVAQEGVHM
jgi:prevent-host-death family protein